MAVRRKGQVGIFYARVQAEKAKAKRWLVIECDDAYGQVSKLQLGSAIHRPLALMMTQWAENIRCKLMSRVRYSSLGLPDKGSF
ncbi:hypothetical protein SAMN04487769_0018 [Burkholderia sp. b14]|nr:hypothetical protein SAMN04487769_0018 [Burkholderia sp. b14]